VLQGALRVDGPLVVSYDFVGHRQAQSDSQQLACHCTIDNYHLPRKIATFRFVILHGHLWGGRFQMAGVGERQVTGESAGGLQTKKD